uniref:Uncharacterized protein n=1 Tax=Panagrolaimus sp. PS1159 TaxID=55785 RepID=A0AC35F4Z0_9BILA
MAEPPPLLVKPNEASSLPLQPVNQNPGSYEDLHRKCRDVFPMCFEGAKIAIQKGLSQFFQVSHTIQKNQIAGAQGTLERRGKLSTYGLMLGNIDLVNQSGVAVGHILRRITERLDLGAELVYQYDKKQLPGGQISALSYALRYTAPTWSFSTTAGAAGITSTYHHKQTEHLQFGVEFEANFRAGESVTTFAYQAELPDAGATMRASIDTNWTVGAVFEQRLSPSLPFTLAISGLLNHAKAAGKFGVGLSIG